MTKKTTVGFWLISGAHKQHFCCTKELSERFSLKSPHEASLRRGQQFRDALNFLGALLLNQVSSGKILSIEEGKFVKHKLEPDWSIKWY